jgi:hypothetical protein
MDALGPSTIVRLYEADSEAVAERLASSDSARMAERGYVTTSARWTEGGRPLTEGTEGLRGRAVILGSVAVLLAILALSWAWWESTSEASEAWVIVLPAFLVVAGVLGLVSAAIARRLTAERHHGRLEVTWKRTGGASPAR